ncbi:hypothetical protein DAEQUDRAFT_730876, partial [Daedalea quercina L-15889]
MGLASPSFAAPIQDATHHERSLTWKEVGNDAQKAGSTALKAISAGAKWYGILKVVREDQGAMDLERRKINWKNVAYTAANDVIDVASTVGDVTKAIKTRSEPKLVEAILRRALDLEEREVDAGSGAIDWKKAGHTAGSVIKSALPLVPLFLREAELDELD